MLNCPDVSACSDIDQVLYCNKESLCDLPPLTPKLGANQTGLHQS